MNLFGFEIRPALPGDLDQICALCDEWDAIHRQARPDLFANPHGTPRDRSEIAVLMAGPDSVILVAEDSAFRRIVGFAMVLTRGMARHRRTAEIDCLTVRKHARRQGIGRLLVREAGRWAADQGFDALELGVFEFNADAIAFYDRMGFETVTRRMGTKVM